MARRYITSMLQNNILRRKISFETGEDRRKAADKIKKEAMQIKRFFHTVAGDMADFDSPFDALALLVRLRSVILLLKGIINLSVRRRS